MAHFDVLSGPRQGTRIPLAAGQIVLGRHPGCDVVLEVAAVSRQHAVVGRADTGHWIEDLGSRNGTLVNGERLTGRYPLADGDEIVIGEVRFGYRSESTPRPDTRSANETAAGFIDDANCTGVIMTSLDAWRPSAEPSAPDLVVSRQRAVNELERVLAGSLGLDDVLPRLLEGVLGVFPNAERGFMLLYDARSRRLVLRAKHFRGGPDEEAVRLSLSLLQRVMESRQGVLSENVADDSQIGATTSFSNTRIRSLMCVPIIDAAGDLLGILQVDTSDASRGFRAGDLELLVGLAGRGSQAVQQALAYQAAIGQEQLRRDLALAHQVQQGLLPVQPPEIGGYEFFDHYEPATEIGGDFFTYVPLAEGRLAVVLADVSGKGISAALVMAALSADVRYCLAMESDPAEAVRRINGGFQRSSWEERFATLVVAVLDPPRERLVIVNAGHPPVMLRTAAGEVKLLDAGRPGLPIGMVDDSVYARVEYALAPGDVIVLYTDGVSEAMDQRHEPYGLERLQLAIESAGGVGPTAVGRAILRDVERHAAGQIRSDDICLVCVGRR